MVIAGRAGGSGKTEVVCRQQGQHENSGVELIVS